MIVIDYEESKSFVLIKSSSYNDGLIQYLKSATSPSWDKARKTWRIAHANASKGLREALLQFDVVIKTTPAFDEAEKTFEMPLKHLSKNVTPVIPRTPIPFYHHQKITLHHNLRVPYFGNFSEVGSGKTFPTITLCDIKHQLERTRILIICPLTIIGKWREEYHLITGRKLSPLIGTPKKRLAALASSNECIINYEGARIIEKQLTEKRFDLVVCDESHRIKSFKAKQARAIVRLSRSAKYRTIMTGTNITNTAIDLFMQFLFLDPKIFGESFYAFRGKYFVNENANQPGKEFYTCKLCKFKQDAFEIKNKTSFELKNKLNIVQCPQCHHEYQAYIRQDYPVWKLKDGAIKKLNERIYSCSIRFTKGECLDLPPEVFELRELIMTIEQERFYNMMLDEMIINLGSSEDGKVTAEYVLTQLIRLQTITAGWVKKDDGTIYWFKNNPKYEELKDILYELSGERIVIWAHFKNDLHMLHKNIPNSAILSGEVAMDKRTEIIKAFNDGNIRVLLGQPGAAGEGINLTAASYSIRYSRSHSLMHYQQSLGRLHRIGAKRKVTNFDLVMKDSYDEIIYKTLKEKKSLLEKINLTFLKNLKHRKKLNP